MNKTKVKKAIRDYVYSIEWKLGEFGMAQHPILTSFATMDIETRELVHITEDNFEKLLEQRLKKIDEAVDEKDLFAMFIHIHKPFRIPVFMRIADELTQKEYSETLIDLWVDTEFPHENGVDLMLMLFAKADKQYLMTDDEKQELEKMNDMIVVYRGLQDNAQEKAMSWTIDKKIAIWFATRFDKKGRVIKAKIQKKHVFAFKDERAEGEIILNPNYLRNAKDIHYEVEEGKKK